MKRLRFTLGGLLLLVLFVSIALAALKASTDYWDSGVFSVTLAVLCASIVLAIQRREAKRFFWISFAVVGRIYLVASIIPAIESRLVTTKLLALSESALPLANVSGAALVDFDEDGWSDLYVSQGEGNGIVLMNGRDGTYREVPLPAGPGRFASTNGVRGRLLTSAVGDARCFIRIGHSLLALLFALASGWFSQYFALRREARCASTVAERAVAA